MGSGDECGRHLERPWGRAGSDYEEHGIIGKGAYGIVYLVTHLASNKQVSIHIAFIQFILRVEVSLFLGFRLECSINFSRVVQG
uniref:Protein kinase domain-containing protein n=1 Tax=Parascaris univalens TaxID=6257 RepID=A0A915AA93_PARUN